jgi:hypothetical protein
LDVHFLGINEIGSEDGNPYAADHTDLPWLQDNSTYHIWDTWGAEKYDIIILDENNVIVDRFDTGTHDLRESVNYEALKALLATYANGGS